MSGLKYLIRTVIFCTAIHSFSVHAQILNMGVNFEKLDLPEEFLQSLENCQPYYGEKPYSRNGVAVNTAYHVLGIEDNLCILQVDGSTNSSVNIHQTCKLPPETAAVYAKALRRYQARGYSPRWDGQYIEKNRDYKAALNIMSDPQLCRFNRDEIDLTKDIRSNLAACSAAMQTETNTDLEITRQIIGFENDRCHYRLQLQSTGYGKSPSEKDVESDSVVPKKLAISFDCLFNREQAENYRQILESLVIPAEEGFDYSAVQRVSPQEEIGFVTEHCVLDTGKTQ